MTVPGETGSAETGPAGLRRRLGTVDLLLLGVGCVVGAGIYILPGVAAAEYAGPAISVSFLLAGLCCSLTGFCYAELSSAMPDVGAAYLYTNRAFGARAALGVAWMLMLEYWLAGATVATGFAAYLESLLGNVGLSVPWALRTAALSPPGAAGGAGVSLNVVALLAILLLAFALTRGIAATARVNTLLVTVKIGVLLIFLGIGALHVNPALWHPFLPPAESGFRYGPGGVLRATSIVIFAYLGFDAVANAAAETRRPGRSVPVGLIGTLLVSTLLYVAVSLVITGLVPFRALDVPDPVARAMAAIGYPQVAIILKIGALTGLASVILVNAYGHSRICMSMAKAGILPGWMARLDRRTGVPRLGIMATALAAGLAAALFPIGMLADVVSVGTMCAFASVALSTMRLRVTAPEMTRHFRVPLDGPVRFGLWCGPIPVAALVVCVVMIGTVVSDLILQARHGHAVALTFLVLYVLAGAGLTEALMRRTGPACDRRMPDRP